MARFGAPHGIRGWIRFRPHTHNPLLLAKRPHCWAAREGGDFVPMTIDEVRQHGGAWLAKMPNCDDRDEAQKWRGGLFAVCRASFPPLPDGGFYLCDLIGLRAFAADGAEIGVVADLMEAGGTVLVIRRTDGGELLAPFIDDYVPEVDVGGGRLTVDMPDAV
ncbi:MAG: ribosome maturation factor RimM [Gammaproteobacteria bacterium]